MVRHYSRCHIRVLATLLASTGALTALITVAPQTARAEPLDAAQQGGSQPRSYVRIALSEGNDRSFRAGPSETLEIQLSDGGSLVMASGAALTVDEYRYDRASGDGVLVLALDHGAVRIMGGLLNQRHAIVMRSGSTGLVLENGAAFIVREPGTLRASLQMGGRLEVRAAGAVQTLTHPGFELTVAGDGSPGQPTQQPRGRAFADAALLNPGLISGGAARLIPASESKADDDTLEDENARRMRPTLAATDNYWMALPDGTYARILPPSTGPLASLGSTGLTNGDTDVVLSQEFAEGAMSNGSAFLDSVNGLRSIGLTANRVLNDGYDFGSIGDTPSILMAPIPQDVLLLNNSVPSSDIAYFVSTTIPAKENHDTVFALAMRQTAPNQFIAFDDLKNLLSYALAVPFEFVFDSSNRLQVNRIDRDLTMLPEPRRPLAASVGANSGLDVFALSAGFLPSTAWLGAFVGEPDSGGIPLLTNPRGTGGSIDNFVMLTAVEDSGRTTIFAAGDVGLTRTSNTSSIDSFVVTRGLEVSDFATDGLVPSLDRMAQFRAFQPESANFTGALSGLSATPMLVYNPGSTSLPAPVFAADLAVSGRSSTISATLGTLTYDTASLYSGRALVTLYGTTVGSTMTPQDGATLFTNPIVATAVGGGGDWGGSGTRPGYASYIVLEPISNAAMLWRFPETDSGKRLAGELNTGALRNWTISEILNLYRVMEVGAEVLFDPADIALLDSITPEERAALDRIRGTSVEEMQVVRGELGMPLALRSLTDAQIDALATGGRASPLGGAESGYGYLRLAAGVHSEEVTASLAAERKAAAGRYDGFVAGLHQVGAGYADGLYQGVLGLELDADRGLAGGVIDYARPAAQPGNTASSATIYESAGSIALGTAAVDGGQGAYIRAGYFGASVTSTDGPNAAVVAGESVKAGLGTADAAKIAKYEHVQWGFFFGDLLPQAGQRTHTALSTWVVGRRADTNERIQGSASYAGHAIGTVATQTDMTAAYTAVGTFEQTWNLDARIGSMVMDFDNHRYAGGNLHAPSAGGQARPGLAYEGYLNNAAGRVLQARIDGELVDVGKVGNNSQPRGTIGTFSIRGFDNRYQATGTFAGDLRH